MNILKALKAMDDGDVVQCLATGLFYRKTTEEKHQGFYDISNTADFEKVTYCNVSFIRQEVESAWSIMNK